MLRLCGALKPHYCEIQGSRTLHLLDALQPVCYTADKNECQWRLHLFDALIRIWYGMLLLRLSSALEHLVSSFFRLRLLDALI
jgi:hypothetical protein